MLIPSGKNWVRNCFSRWGWITRRRGRSRRRSWRGDFPSPVAATVQTLEARVLLSSIVVNSTSDTPSSGNVTLRDAINAGVDTITFDPTVFLPNTLTTIKLTNGPLELTHNVTIDGPGAGQVAVSGGNATLTCETTAGHIYHLERTANLSPAAWTRVAGSTTTATGASVIFSFPASGNPAFYRVVSP